MAMSPKGVARTATLCTVFSMISGMVMPERDQREPATMPRMIGLVRIPQMVFFSSGRSMDLMPGFKKESTITAMIL